jgi:hypothetical protein
MKKVNGRLLIIIAFSASVFGCQTIPKDAFKLNESALSARQLQTRFYETNNELELLIAGAGALQDMGFNIDETEKDLGLITASKSVDATDGFQVAGAVLIALLGGGATPIDKEQKIRVSFVTGKSVQNDKYRSRVTFQRIVWNTRNQISRVETLSTPELYTEFFDKISKAVFLEAQDI